MPHFGNYDPASFGWVKPAEFAPYSWRGVRILGGINPAPGFAVLLTRMLDNLVPFIPGGLVPGWNWGGDYADAVAQSFHLYGLAVDLNAPANPMTSRPHPFGGTDVLPANTGLFTRPFGFEWGGDWYSPKDYMHVECHLTPDEVAVYAAVHSVVPTPIGQWIMTLPGTPPDLTYDKLINDIANIILSQLPLDEHQRAIAMNNIVHGLNADGGKR